MALTRDFKETVQARVLADPKFRDALLKKGIEIILVGDVDGGKAILRDCIKAKVGFEKLGADTGSSPKSLIRMFGPSCNLQARNPFGVLSTFGVTPVSRCMSRHSRTDARDDSARRASNMHPRNSRSAQSQVRTSGFHNESRPCAWYQRRGGSHTK